jgi:ferredoxin
VVESQARKITVTVDHDVCVGNASCVAIAPAVFVLDENRQSIVVDPGGAALEDVLEAADDCPVSAITVVDALTGEKLNDQG